MLMIWAYCILGAMLLFFHSVCLLAAWRRWPTLRDLARVVRNFSGFTSPNFKRLYTNLVSIDPGSCYNAYIGNSFTRTYYHNFTNKCASMSEIVISSLLETYSRPQWFMLPKDPSTSRRFVTSIFDQIPHFYLVYLLLSYNPKINLQ